MEAKTSVPSLECNTIFVRWHTFKWRRIFVAHSTAYGRVQQANYLLMRM